MPDDPTRTAVTDPAQVSAAADALRNLLGGVQRGKPLRHGALQLIPLLPAVAPAIEERVPLTWTALAPLALPDLPEHIARGLVKYLLDDRRFWTAIAPPAVALDEPAFSLREHFDGLRRYWRGPTWVNSAWLVWRGMVRLGYEQQAATLARAITEMVSREGLREFYDPHDGRGMGAQDFAWSALALELLDPRNASAGIPPIDDVGA